MPACCVAVNCKNAGASSEVDAQGRPITLHLFPKDPESRQQWALAVHRKGPGGALWKPSRFSRLCSAHFTEDCIDRSGQAVRIHKGAIPTLFNLWKRLKRRAIKPKPPDISSREETAPLADCTESAMEEFTQSRREIKEAMDKDHNYFCASSSKSLKLTLDKLLQTEEKLLKRLRNVKKRESRLTDRVCWLVMQLERKQKHEQPAEASQEDSGAELLKISQENNQEDSFVKLLLNPASATSNDMVIHGLKQEPVCKLNKYLPENKLNSSLDGDGSLRSAVQLRTHNDETARSCKEPGLKVDEQLALKKDQNYCTEESTPEAKPHPYFESSKCSRPTRKQLRCIGRKQFQCKVCGKSYSFLKTLRVHQRKHPVTATVKSESINENVTPSDVKPERRRVKKDKPYQCSQCEKSFSREKYFIRHEKVHTEENTHACKVCGKVFSQFAYRMQHEKMHSKQRIYKCNQCDKSFRGTSDLKRHRKTHSGEKPFQCSECGKSFSLADYLKVHQKIHTGETRCICSECGKCFSRVSYLKTHNRIHTGEKPYTCPECGKSFIDTLRLSRHRLTHKGKKPFQCTECGKSFTSKINVTRHERKHANVVMAEEKRLTIELK
ncbi:zinc finger protein ZFP2-like isoform X1 [Ambystoma mexicanum]|uniref:zinc finger protein ZFP2-like isoform X1 n=1 Tax=Ambystoma mexicanum TaxID=8296 RepID=UPI0037E83E77